MGNFDPKLLGNFDPKKTFVCVIVPTRGTIDMATHISLERLALAFNEAGIHFAETCGGMGMPGDTREEFIGQALQSPCTHILFVDNDVGFREETPIRLLASGFDMCAGVYQQRRDGGDYCFLSLPGEPKIHPVNGFIEVEAVGFGMTLVKRAVIEKMHKAYRDLLYYTDGGAERTALFIETVRDGRRQMEDYSFCHRWRAIGGQIWIDPQARMLHAGRKEWVASVSDILVQEKITPMAPG